MAGRGGRGGRGARGGVSRSFNREQLNSMGVSSNEMLPGLVTQPPPLYPILDRKPVPLQPCREIDYHLILKQVFTDQVHLSPSYLKMPVNSKSIHLNQEIDKLVAQIQTVKEKYNWRLFPAELRPRLMAKKTDLTKTIIKKNIDINKRLSQLEKHEVKVVDNEDVEVEVKTENENPDDVDLVEEEQDEEMDDGTDYANNYFDNGEDYEDEDDNLDDGPIY